MGGRLPEPPLSPDAPVDLPRGIRKELSQAISDEEHLELVLRHATAALAALDDRDGETAAPHLRWIKQRASRSGLVREALGVSLYLAEQYEEALSELAAYRRLTGRQDQNHLVADASRAVGQNADRIPELVRLMEADDEAGDAAKLEGRIVWASWLADGGDVGAGRAVLRDVLAPKIAPADVEEHHLRAWYVAADLAERADDVEAAIGYLRRVTAAADGFYDAEERLERLSR